MSRVQLALNVDDIEEGVKFYTQLFGVEPAKRRPGYANFAITEPALKLVLLENPGKGGSLNHLGVEHADMDGVAVAADRLEAAGLRLDHEGDVVCCYARQSKHWVTGPGGEKWENYVVLADAGAELEGKTAAELTDADAAIVTETASSGGGCCGTARTDSSETEPAAGGVCCA
jgi:catechol 2,3-dioxygenase-like lactoylglutathione lyase family enzyme